MFGKATVFLVCGFSMLFLVFGHNFGNLANRATDNMTDYYTKTKSHNISISGANMASSQLFFDKNWTTGYNNIAFDGGTLKVTVTPSGDNRKIVSIGTFNGVVETTTVSLAPSNFAKYGNFYANLSAAPATGDTFKGPFHSNVDLKVYGNPVFWGKTTCKNGLTKLINPSNPKFYGGFESGIDLPLQYDFSTLEAQASKIYVDPAGTKKVNVRLYFNADGTVTHQMQIGTGAWSAALTVPVTTLAPNGIIFVKDGDVFVKGTVCGQVSIMANNKGTNTNGNIYLVDDIKYKTDPRVDPNSSDLLGLVAKNMIRIQYNNDTKVGKDIITQASMFALNSTIGPEDNFFNSATNYPYLKSWKILGGLIAQDTRQTACYSGGNPVRGLRFVHTFDERFYRLVPPAFPHTICFEVVSWRE
jgi:hypothetical protein